MFKNLISNLIKCYEEVCNDKLADNFSYPPVCTVLTSEIQQIYIKVLFFNILLKRSLHKFDMTHFEKYILCQDSSVIIMKKSAHNYINNY